MSIIDHLTSTNYAVWSNKVKLALSMRNLDAFLNPEWTSSLREDENEETCFRRNSCKQIYCWMGNRLDQENFDKFYEHDPSLMWVNTENHYCASSAENCASIFRKIFSLSMDESNVKDFIIEIRHQVNLLKMVGKKIFDVNTLTKVLAFYVLQSLPSTLQMTANNIYQSTEIFGSIPTLNKVLSEIEISLSRKNEQSKVSFNALKAQENKNQKWKCRNGKHDPIAPHSEEHCFKLHPEKVEAFRARKIGREKAKDSPPKIFATYSASAISSSAILDSGASYSMFKDSSRFVLVKGTQISLSLADGSSITASGIGTTIIHSNDGQPNYLQNSLVIPSISVPLIALGPLLKKNCFLISKGDGVELVSSNGETLLTGSLTDRVVCVKLVEPKANHISCRYETLAIHKALGHPSLQYATRMRPDMDFSSVN